MLRVEQVRCTECSIRFLCSGWSKYGALSAAYGSYAQGGASTAISDAIKKEKSIVDRKVNVVGGDPK